jgi:hypothetical protein
MTKFIITTVAAIAISISAHADAAGLKHQCSGFLEGVKGNVPITLSFTTDHSEAVFVIPGRKPIVTNWSDGDGYDENVLTFSTDFDSASEDNQFTIDVRSEHKEAKLAARNADHGSDRSKLALSPSSNIDAVCIWDLRWRRTPFPAVTRTPWPPRIARR